MFSTEGKQKVGWVLAHAVYLRQKSFFLAFLDNYKNNNPGKRDLHH